MKYRLKKDLPTLKAGAIFSDEDNEEMSWGRNLHYTDEDGILYRFYTENIDNFDEWFEEVGKSRYRRKLVKAVHGKGTRINYMAVKTFYLPVGEWDSEHKAAFRMEPGDVAGFAGYDEDVKGYINQMVELGFIEVEDNPNIVWEDEDAQS